eukprot:m.21429 g.21429  ORF g.21429 m.21429 type:complete len:72 (+) comp12416_c0_seq1:247-462(+)
MVKAQGETVMLQKGRCEFFLASAIFVVQQQQHFFLNTDLSAKRACTDAQSLGVHLSSTKAPSNAAEIYVLC